MRGEIQVEESMAREGLQTAQQKPHHSKQTLGICKGYTQGYTGAHLQHAQYFKCVCLDLHTYTFNIDKNNREHAENATIGEQVNDFQGSNQISLSW